MSSIKTSADRLKNLKSQSFGVLIAQSQFGDGFADPALGGIFSGTDSKAGTTQALSNLELFISRIIGFLTIFGSIFFIAYFVLGAFSWITAGGDSSKIQKARDQMVNGVLGLIVIVAAYGLIGIIGTVVGLNILEPAKMLRTTFNL